MSVKDYVDEMLVFDDDSSDHTWKIINMIRDKKIKAERGSFINAATIRNQLLSKTKTDWFLILDGDEVWNSDRVMKLIKYLETCPKDTQGVFVRTRNCVGDVFHYQPESAGKYTFLGMTGNYSMRAFRNISGFKWGLDYPRETFFDNKGMAVDKKVKNISFCDTYYWHMTFLPRTFVQSERKYRQISKIENGIKVVNEKELPSMFFVEHPSEVSSALTRRSFLFEIQAKIISPLKEFKRKF